MAAYTSWRVLFSGNNGHATKLSVTLLEMRGWRAGVNLCVGGVASASSGTASKAFNLADSWDVVMPSEYHWLRYDFATPTEVKEYAITSSGTEAPSDWKLQYSDGNEIWVDAHIAIAQRFWLTESRYFAVQLCAIDVTVNMSRAGYGFNLSLLSLFTGELLYRKRVGNGVYRLYTQDLEPVMVTVVQAIGARWTPRTFFDVGKTVYPTNPELNPFYYRALKAGVTGSSEPVWHSNPESFIYDGVCVWLLVERIEKPITQSPLIPQIVG